MSRTTLEFLFIFLTLQWSISTYATSGSESHKTYKSGMYGISFKYPSEWEILDDGGNSSEKLDVQIKKTAHIVVIRSKETPPDKFDLYFDVDHETCEQHALESERAENAKISLTPKALGQRTWLVGPMVGSAMSAADSTFIACTVIKKNFSKFKTKNVLLILTSYSFLANANHGTRNDETLEKRALELLNSLSLK